MGTPVGLRDGFCKPELLPRNEYLAAENRIFGAKLPARLRRSNPERHVVTRIPERLICDLGDRPVADSSRRVEVKKITPPGVILHRFKREPPLGTWARDLRTKENAK